MFGGGAAALNVNPKPEPTNVRLTESVSLFKTSLFLFSCAPLSSSSMIRKSCLISASLRAKTVERNGRETVERNGHSVLLREAFSLCCVCPEPVVAKRSSLFESTFKPGLTKNKCTVSSNLIVSVSICIYTCKKRILF